jgi:succinylglutamate desuccinylase
MLQVFDDIPPGLLECNANELYQILTGPALIHLQGRRQPAVFVSVLLHGNEDTGWLAVRELLKEYRGRALPRALSLFIGNVEAARHQVRMRAGQPDFNRIWGDVAGADALRERAIVSEVVRTMRERRVFASIDIHNNTGVNPHYACVRRIDHRFFRLATLFSRTVVYFTKPDGVQPEPFSDFCPAVTVECGRAGQDYGVTHALEYLHTCLNLSEISDHPVAHHDMNLFHTVATVKVPPEFSIGLEGEDVDIRLAPDIDSLNFQELPVDTVIGWIRRGSSALLHVSDETGHDAANRFFRIVGGAICTAVPVMPSMFTNDVQAIRQDCLGYIMESLNGDSRLTSPGMRQGDD